jgi:hypothetical protein
MFLYLRKAKTEQVTTWKYPERETFGGSFLYEKVAKTTPELCAMSVTVIPR